MTKPTFIASCPVCGRTLFKGSPSSYVESGCPKCKEYLKITFIDNGFQVLTGINKSDTTVKNEVLSNKM
ncbi:MAG: hypothetical protein U0K93_02345 [Acutalibacteraceae bacterium]|nr:hypothetical protein [Acutalibacteraceae bacterium]